MIQSKKGISDVITTVLIILLVLAAVVIIWSFIRGQLDSTTKTIDLQSQCMNTQLEVSCKETSVADIDPATAGNQAGTSYAVSARLTGATDGITKVKLILSDKDTGATVGTPDDATVSGITVDKSWTLANPQTDKRGSAAILLTDEGGKAFVCPESPKIDCI